MKPTEDDDDESVLFLLDGGSYRVAVDGKTVREIAVSGEGSRTFVVEVPTGVPAAAPTREPVTELTSEQRAAQLEPAEAALIAGVVSSPSAAFDVS